MKLNYNSIEIEGIDTSDYPDFCDAYISYAEFENGIPLDDDQLDVLNEDSDLVYNETIKKVF